MGWPRANAAARRKVITYAPRNSAYAVPGAGSKMDLGTSAVAGSCPSNTTARSDTPQSDFVGYSGATEIDPSGAGLQVLSENPDACSNPAISSDLIDALAACHHLGATQLLAPAWKDRVNSFAPPYRLFLEMLAGGDNAVDHVLADPYFHEQRVRALSREKIALIALTIFVKPAAEYRSLCSDYAYVLEHARDQSVAPEDLSDWLRKTTLSNCKAAVRRSRRLLKRINASADPTGVEDLPQLIDEVSSAFRVKVSGQQVVVRLSLPFGDREHLPQMLRQLADELEHATWDNGEINGQLF